MNFIAHLLLSGKNESVLIGNFIADQVKGKHFFGYDESVQNGILIHRKIDSFTDKHFLVKNSKKVFIPDYNHYSSVIVDIVYDHFLVMNWHLYSEEPLSLFSKDVFRILSQHKKIFPELSSFFLEYLIENDGICKYKDLNEIEKVLVGMSNRTSFKSNMELSIIEIKENYDRLQNDFLSFFPHLIAYVKPLL